MHLHVSPASHQLSQDHSCQRNLDSPLHQLQLAVWLSSGTPLPFNVWGTDRALLSVLSCAYMKKLETGRAAARPLKGTEQSGHQCQRKWHWMNQTQYERRGSWCGGGLQNGLQRKQQGGADCSSLNKAPCLSFANECVEGSQLSPQLLWLSG